ncbi:MAG: histidinol-phosphate aminotransferase family protein [Lachnospiraceae bacterium]|nr:histidinol-phosphate aminotransferase family protein [Lachnospiraceae bacterium]
MDYYVNPYIKQTERIFPMQGRADYLRYDMNENPEGLPQEIVDEIRSRITPEFLATYPEPDRFLTKYAAFIGTDTDHVVATNGSDMAIRYLLETFGEPGRDVVTVSPSFEMYRINCSLLGLRHVPVSYREDLTIDVEDIVAAIGTGTRIVVLLNPNNPVGNVFTDEEFERILRRTKEVGAVLIIDEAYHYFCRKTFLQYALTEENVVILRTFSKLFSLAAVRLGVVIGPPRLLHFMKNAKLSFDVNSIALLAGETVLDHPELVGKLQAIADEGKAYVLQALTDAGYETKDCAGNFFFVKPHHDAKHVSQVLETEKKVLVHPFGNPLLKDLIRVSVGSKSAMEKFVEAFLAADQE